MMETAENRNSGALIEARGARGGSVALLVRFGNPVEAAWDRRDPVTPTIGDRVTRSVRRLARDFATSTKNKPTAWRCEDAGARRRRGVSQRA
jgi:hypothetical protein